MALAAVLTAAAIVSPAAAITVGAGWNNDESTGAGGLTLDSQAGFYNFTIGQDAVFTYTDCCVADDEYEVFNFGGLVQTSALIAGTAFEDMLGESAALFDMAWESDSYHGGQILLRAGTYELAIRTITPSTGSLGTRLDLMVVPVPGALGLILVALAGLGLIGRRLTD